LVKSERRSKWIVVTHSTSRRFGVPVIDLKFSELQKIGIIEINDFLSLLQEDRKSFLLV